MTAFTEEKNTMDFARFLVGNILKDKGLPFISRARPYKAPRSCEAIKRCFYRVRIKNCRCFYTGIPFSGAVSAANRYPALLKCANTRGSAYCIRLQALVLS